MGQAKDPVTSAWWLELVELSQLVGEENMWLVEANGFCISGSLFLEMFLTQQQLVYHFYA